MTDAKTHYLAGLKHFGANRYEESIVEYRQALAMKPDWAELYNAIATAESKLGRLDDAVATIHKAIELNPNDAFFFTSLSIFLQRQGKIPEAEAAAAKARMISWKEELKKNPNAPPPGPAGSMNVVQ
jgi:tetratricopeptide (TPR) repeat protein